MDTKTAIGMLENAPGVMVGNQRYVLMKSTVRDRIVEMLKGTPITPILVREGRNKTYNDYECPVCGQMIAWEQRYCCECGMPIEWRETDERNG